MALPFLDTLHPVAPASVRKATFGAGDPIRGIGEARSDRHAPFHGRKPINLFRVMPSMVKRRGENKKFVLGRKAMSCCNALSCRVVHWWRSRRGHWPSAVAAPAESDAPITVGFAMSVTGPLAPNGKQALAGAKIWEGNQRQGRSARP
jgi:hypothetical protein